jgi:hypothetical protein
MLRTFRGEVVRAFQARNALRPIKTVIVARECAAPKTIQQLIQTAANDLLSAAKINDAHTFQELIRGWSHEGGKEDLKNYLRFTRMLRALQTKFKVPVRLQLIDETSLPQSLFTATIVDTGRSLTDALSVSLRQHQRQFTDKPAAFQRSMLGLGRAFVVQYSGFYKERNPLMVQQLERLCQARQAEAWVVAAMGAAHAEVVYQLLSKVQDISYAFLQHPAEVAAELPAGAKHSFFSERLIYHSMRIAAGQGMTEAQSCEIVLERCIYDVLTGQYDLTETSRLSLAATGALSLLSDQEKMTILLSACDSALKSKERYDALINHLSPALWQHMHSEFNLDRALSVPAFATPEGARQAWEGLLHAFYTKYIKVSSPLC